MSPEETVEIQPLVFTTDDALRQEYVTHLENFVRLVNLTIDSKTLSKQSITALSHRVCYERFTVKWIQDFAKVHGIRLK